MAHKRRSAKAVNGGWRARTKRRLWSAATVKGFTTQVMNGQ